MWRVKKWGSVFRTTKMEFGYDREVTEMVMGSGPVVMGKEPDNTLEGLPEGREVDERKVG